MKPYLALGFSTFAAVLLVPALLSSCKTVSAPEQAKPAAAAESPWVGVKEKKLIQFGWNTPTRLEHFQRPLNELEETAPFDGLGIWLNLDLLRDGKKIRYDVGSAKGAPQLLYKEDFKDWVPALRRLRQTRLKTNFIRSSSVLFQADWFDDAGWARTLNNYSMLAWLAKESGCKGISLDIEAYSFSGKPFKFYPEKGHTLEETQAQVRKRAAEWVTELNRQYPGLTLFTFFWASQCNSAAKAAHPELDYSGDTALEIAFFNGVYDAAPENMTIVDGNESAGYACKNDVDYLSVVTKYHLYGNRWIEKKNQAKYHAITQMGFSFYMDSYIPRPMPGAYNIFESSDNPTQLLFTNMQNALKYTEEYVWLWTEKGTFWPKITGSKKALFWNDRLPYTKEAIDMALAVVKGNFTPGDKGPNLLVNPDMNPSKNDGKHAIDPGHALFGVPGWSCWQGANAFKGQIVPEDGAVVFKYVQNAAITQVYKNFKPGEQYVFTVLCKCDSPLSKPSISAFFRDKRGNGLFNLVSVGAFVEDEGNGWKRATTLIDVPAIKDLSGLTLALNVSGAGGATPKDDKGCRFDKAELFTYNLPWSNLPKPVIKDK